MEEKCQIMEDLRCHSKMNSCLNLYFDARHKFSHEDMITMFSLLHTCTSSIVVINEGSLQYLTHNKKNIMIKNIKYLLDHLGGCCIIPNLILYMLVTLIHFSNFVKLNCQRLHAIQRGSNASIWKCWFCRKLLLGVGASVLCWTTLFQISFL
jgi:hypothetical protein